MNQGGNKIDGTTSTSGGSVAQGNNINAGRDVQVFIGTGGFVRKLLNLKAPSLCAWAYFSKATDSPRSAIVQWLSPLKFYQKQLDILDTWCPGTGQWFLDSEIFEDWRSGTLKSLWCCGDRRSQFSYIQRRILEHSLIIHVRLEQVVQGRVCSRMFYFQSSIPSTCYELNC